MTGHDLQPEVDYATYKHHRRAAQGPAAAPALRSPAAGSAAPPLPPQWASTASELPAGAAGVPALETDVLAVAVPLGVCSGDFLSVLLPCGQQVLMQVPASPEFGAQQPLHGRKFTVCP